MALRGRTNYFRHGVSKATFDYLNITRDADCAWLRRKHPGPPGSRCDGITWPGWLPEHDGEALFNTSAVPVTRYRYRGTKIPTPWVETNKGPHSSAA